MRVLAEKTPGCADEHGQSSANQHRLDLNHPLELIRLFKKIATYREDSDADWQSGQYRRQV